MNTLPWFIAQRYNQSRSGSRFTRFISAASVVGISLGVAVMILISSVMNGFKHELSSRFLSVIPHIEFVAVQPPLNLWQESATALEAHPEVLGASPQIVLEGLVDEGTKYTPITLRAVDVKTDNTVSGIASYLIEGDWKQLDNHPNGVFIGEGLAQQLKVSVGDSIRIMLMPIASRSSTVISSSKLQRAKYLSLTILGVFKTSGQMDYGLGMMNLKDAQHFLGWDASQVQRLRIKVRDVFAINEYTRELGQLVQDYVYIHNWQLKHGHVYRDIQLVRSIMYIVMALVIAVASFNIVSTLVMSVREKNTDIAILMTMGASRKQIAQVFMLQGFTKGCKSVVIGLSIGLILSYTLNDILIFVSHTFGVQILDSNVYFIDFIPSKIAVVDIITTLSISLFLVFLSTTYPAVKSSKLTPKALLNGE